MRRASKDDQTPARPWRDFVLGRTERADSSSLKRLFLIHGEPMYIQSDKGSESIARRPRVAGKMNAPAEVEYFVNGGIPDRVLRQLQRG